MSRLGDEKTIRDVAERILFGNSLEEKLAPPPTNVRDERRGELLSAPITPGRPDALKLQTSGVRAEFPGTQGIEDDEHRGRLLHFFANHELLATELMALVLLRFPDAPDEFRAGVMRTLKEEQMHTKLYLRRMEECGVCFGDLPVNGFFWKAVAPMPTPVDYVTRLSLTFEQANLDFSRGYAKIFAQSGDDVTAGILDRIYRDEISHVNYGLEWFRRWKGADHSDWESYLSRLELPLSAARAKGAFAFNEEGRREAGLDEEFIRELRVYVQSKGRTPNVFWFNPGAEESIVGGEETSAARQVAHDLALLPAYLARQEDVVVVPALPPTSFRTELLERGIALPELVERSAVSSLRERKLHELRPWGRTPDALPLIKELAGEETLTAPELFSKAEHARFLGKLLDDCDHPFWGGLDTVGTPVDSLDDVRSAVDGKEGEWILKAPWSTAGRNRIRLSGGEELSTKAVAWIEETLRLQNQLVLERWLERVIDFSVQYDHQSDSGLRRRGLVVLENTPQGQFQRATVAERFTDFLEEEVRRRLFDGASRRGLLFELLEERLEPSLQAWLESHGYEGPIGVDCFFYRDRDGDVRWKPVVEINPRYTMGRIAVELARFTPSSAVTSLVIGKVGSLPAAAMALTPQGQGTRLVAGLHVR